MNKKVLTVLLLTLFLVGSTVSARAAPSDNSARPVCPGPASPSDTHCHAWVRPNASTSPVGLSPATMKAVYGYSTSSTAGAGKTIAIVDAYDLPTAEK